MDWARVEFEIGSEYEIVADCDNHYSARFLPNKGSTVRWPDKLWWGIKTILCLWLEYYVNIVVMTRNHINRPGKIEKWSLTSSKYTLNSMHSVSESKCWDGKFVYLSATHEKKTHKFLAIIVNMTFITCGKMNKDAYSLNIVEYCWKTNLKHFTSLSSCLVGLHSDFPLPLFPLSKISDSLSKPSQSSRGPSTIENLIAFDNVYQFYAHKCCATIP